MAISLNLLPVTLTDLSAINPLTGRTAMTATTVSNAAVAESTSSVVRLSALGRFLAATPATDTPVLTASTVSQTTPVVTAAPPSSVPNADTLAAVQSASAATVALQSLVNDPALRAIANNLFNPVYSALLAAAHQADFTTPQPPLTRADAIPIDIPAPIMSVARSEAIGNDKQSAQEFGYRQSNANS